MLFLMPAVASLLVLSTASAQVPDRSFLTESEHAYGYVLPDEIRDTWQARGVSYGYDVDHVDLDLAVDFDVNEITCVSTLTVTITEANQFSIPIDLDDALNVTAVTVDGSPSFFSHVNDQVNVNFTIPPGMGTQLDVAISYNGRPLEVGNKSMRFRTHAGVPLVYTLSTPYSTSGNTVIPISHYWRPCKDVADDKSTYSCAITVPDTMFAVSNGGLTGTADNGDGTKTYSWEHNYPVAPYLITIGVTNYSEIQDEYVGSGGNVPIRHYAWPEHLANATSDWSVTVPQMHVFADRFGEYPFLGEKLGNYETPSGPAVEHQTAISTPNTVINGNGTYDWLNAHETSHMWFGDNVTVADWADVWLSEGPASYAEALWRESSGGATALRAYMLGMDAGPYAGTVYDPPYIWHAIVYDKGAWILHMLRHILGDDDFFQALQNYQTNHAYGNVVTDDFIADAEIVYGDDLNWFFDPWVFEEGRPDYQYQWETTSALEGFTVALTIDQVQSMDFPTYTMPIDVAVTTASGTETSVVTNSLRTEQFQIPVADEPLAVQLDPDRWILADFTEISVDVGGTSVAPRAFLASSVPNPFRARTSIDFGLSRESTIALRVFDASGRLVRTLARGRVPAGEHEVIWDGTDNRGRPVASGTYLYQLVSPDGVKESRVTVLR